MEKWYSVTFMRIGSAMVMASSPEEAMRIADEAVKADEVTWLDDWPAVDAREVNRDDQG